MKETAAAIKKQDAEAAAKMNPSEAAKVENSGREATTVA